ncbi:hypothetical protein [Streptomyces sp. L2]|uniref:hypothetical protein n=1 Tax=Streptomyces sp. L2 TaxID=2162665 RepID=UPI001012FADC|nr:hypothetical protein [Streptomyces sp. L2]
MRRTLHALLRFLIAACIGLILPLGTSGKAEAAMIAVVNGTHFTDIAGQEVRGHDGGVIKVGEYYYFFGENHYSDYRFQSVSMYRSTDLQTWEFRNNVP